MNNSIHYSQSNTRAGFLILACAASMVGKEGLLAFPTDDGPALVTGVTNPAIYLILEGGATESTFQPIDGDQNVRVRVKGAGSKGDTMVLATGGDLGKVTKLVAQTGQLFSPGIAEEDYVDGQLVLVRPWPRFLTGSGGAIAFTGVTPVATAAALTSYGFTQPQADALVANVREMRAALISHGIMAPNV